VQANAEKLKPETTGDDRQQTAEAGHAMGSARHVKIGAAGWQARTPSAKATAGQAGGAKQSENTNIRLCGTRSWREWGKPKAHGGTRTAKDQTQMGKDKCHKLRGGLPHRKRAAACASWTAGEWQKCGYVMKIQPPDYYGCRSILINIVISNCQNSLKNGCLSGSKVETKLIAKWQKTSRLKTKFHLLF
jgi:hypothetical protein